MLPFSDKALKYQKILIFKRFANFIDFFIKWFRQHGHNVDPQMNSFKIDSVDDSLFNAFIVNPFVFFEDRVVKNLKLIVG